MRYHLSFVVSLVAIVAVGCTRVDSTVSRFHELTPDTKGKSFAIVPLEPQRGSIEFKQYADQVAAKLVAAGYTQHPELIGADYAIFITYGVGDGKTVTSQMPLYGQTGGGTSYYNGTVNSMGAYGSSMGSYSGTVYTPPTYGVVGLVPVTNTYYTRQLQVDIIDLAKSTETELHRAFEGKVVSTGSSATFSEVSRCLIDAMFKDFPGESGKSERVVEGADCMK